MGSGTLVGWHFLGDQVGSDLKYPVVKMRRKNLIGKAEDPWR